jgi:hypothetical protein
MANAVISVYSRIVITKDSPNNIRVLTNPNHDTGNEEFDEIKNYFLVSVY